MKFSVLSYLVVILVCIASLFAHYYLNVVATNNLAQQEQNKFAQHHPNDTAPHAPQPSNDSNRTIKPTPAEQDMLPDIQFVKFVLQKGREGIPVLSFGNIFKAFW